MKKSSLWLLCFLLIPAILYAQSVEVKRERIFTGSGLYGYMNGGAEQFLEYGVSKLTVRDVLYNGEEYTIEIYEMPTPEDAFGIYSLHIFKCERANTLGCIDCLSSYQLQTVAGNTYTSVVFPSGTTKAKNQADQLVRLYVPMDGKDNPQIPTILNNHIPHSGTIKYLKGPISVSGVCMPLTKLLERISYHGIWFISDKPSKSYQALIEFKEKKDIPILKSRLVSSDILEEGKNFLFIKGKETGNDDSEEDYGGFGF